MSNQIDLNDLLKKRGKIEILPPESDEDAKHRRSQDKLKTGVALFFIVAGITMAALFFCIGSDGQQKWAQAALSTAFGAAIAYVIKK